MLTIQFTCTFVCLSFCRQWTPSIQKKRIK